MSRFELRVRGTEMVLAVGETAEGMTVRGVDKAINRQEVLVVEVAGVANHTQAPEPLPLAPSPPSGEGGEKAKGAAKRKR